MTPIFSCLKCRRTISSERGRCPVCSPQRLHMATSVRVCQTNRCGHFALCPNGGDGCDLHPQRPGRLRNHLLAGGGCFADPPQFGELSESPRVVRRWKKAEAFDRIDEVALITFHYNPEKYHRLRQTYYEWLPTLGPLAKSLRCYEMVLDDDQPEIDGSIVIRGTRAKHSLWQKEAIINRALRDTPPGINYFVWIDHDMVIDRRDWLANAVAQIDAGAPAVQLVGDLHYLTRDQIPSAPRTSAMKNYRTTGRYTGNPGGAWIASTEYLRAIGGLDTGNIVGGGDQVFFDAMVGKPGWHVSQYPPALAESVTRWIANASQSRYGREAGHVDADVYHLWHGDRKNRQYGDRNKILMAGGYDPAIDTRLNDDGLMEWCSDKPEMHAGVAAYFASRREDG